MTPPAGVSAAPGENNIMLWNAVIFGPHDTPFEDGTFKLMMEFSEEYPNKPLVVKFLSEMFHPNISADGLIYLDILQNRWSAAYDGPVVQGEQERVRREVQGLRRAVVVR